MAVPPSNADPSKADALNVHEIMERIRNAVEQKLASPREKFVPQSASDASAAEAAAFQSGELLHSAELRTINQRHAFSLDVNPGRITDSHRGFFIGRFITALKRKLLVLIRDSILADYLKAEHEYNSALTQYLNTVTRYIDERDSADFWRLVRKIDVDTNKSVERIDRIDDELRASIAMLANERAAKISEVATQSTGDPVNQLAISPAMSPQMVLVARAVNSIAQRLQLIEQRLDATSSRANTVTAVDQGF